LLHTLTMHLTINVKSPNNISKWQMEFNSAFKGLIRKQIFSNVLLWLVQPCTGTEALYRTYGP
jgi:hypothetical protein